MTDRFLAHFNFARLALDLKDPRLGGFLKGRDPIRRIAEGCEGFVWKQEIGAGEGTVDGDPRLLLSLSVWKSPEALWHFAWNTLHKRFWLRRGDWFEKIAAPTFAMWWVARDHRPDHAEAWARIDHMRGNGETDFAFGWNFLSERSNRNVTPVTVE